VLTVIMIFSWYRMASGGGGDSLGIGPAHASAASLMPVRAGGAVLPDNLRAASSASATVQALLEWQRRPIAPLSRNLFVINYDFFPQDGSAPAAPVHVQQGDGFWDHIAKSMTARADQKREREVLVENLRGQALQLKLQSTVLGASPRALVNGQLVRVGDVVASFRVTKIEARRIVVEREGIKLEVRSN
jgi:hypothetical protein